MSKVKTMATKYWVMLALGVLFVGPLVAAWSFYVSGDRWVPSTMNYGHLIEPPVSLSALNTQRPDGELLTQKNFGGKWLMLYVEPSECHQQCQKTLYMMRQIRIALNKDVDRVERVVATFPSEPAINLIETIATKYPGMQHIVIDKSHYVALLPKLLSAQQLDPAGNIYVVDPLGNVILSYQANTNPDGIYEDLHRLLKVSQIG